MDYGALALMIPIIAVCIPIVAILVGPLSRRMALDERREARKLYERIVMEKMDVIRTAIAMGHSQAELRELDRRLAALIGADEIKTLLDEKSPGVPLAKNELRDVDLSDEMKTLERKVGQAD
jgi:hypothetical protein